MTDTVDRAELEHHDVKETPGHPGGDGVIKPEYDARLANDDLAPLRSRPGRRTTSSRSGCPTCTASAATSPPGSLFALGIASWQVLFALIVGIAIVNVFCNLVAKPSQVTGVPYPVINRAIFGVLGANIPAIIRGCIAIAWYGVQTYLAVPGSLIIIFLKFWPGLGGAERARRLPRPVRARLHLLRDPVGRPGGRVLERHGGDPPVHRLGRPRRLRGHGRARRLPGQPRPASATSASTCPSKQPRASASRSR